MNTEEARAAVSRAMDRLREFSRAIGPNDHDMLEAAIEALVTGGENCPFSIAGALNDGLHVDITDPECYARSADFGPEWAVQCRICVREALEERAIGAKGL